MSTKEKYKALISALLNAWGGKATVKSAKSIEINGTAHNPAAVVVKTWTANDGSSWYRKYSDGWIEQGGRFAKSGYGYTTVTFPVAFSKIVYYAGVNHQGDYRGINMSKTTLTGSTQLGYEFDTCWYACGY